MQFDVLRRAPHLSAALSALATVAIALPFLWSFTRPPSTNFWPMAASWLCFALLLLISAVLSTVARPWSPRQQADLVAAGLLLAALASSCIGLAQYFGLRDGLSPWVYDAPLGQAMGNLRQRNQQATLLSLGIWSLVWWVLHAEGARAGQLLAMAAMALLAVGSAATASRTALLQWLLLLALAWLWRARWGWRPARWLAGGLALYLVAAWALPALLWRTAGLHGSVVFERVAASYGCGSRRVLWSNVLDLIALRPWGGWGWGELDYAHYVTLFPGQRFCALLDNAHNLPLHLAVELGVPAACLLLGVVAWLVWRAAPWRERVPQRQLAWGVLLPIAAHSMLEFPLWYGPFQLTALCALALLLGREPAPDFRQKVPLALYLKAFIAILLIVFVAAAARQYLAVSQLYLPAGERGAAPLRDAQGRVAGAPLFDDAARFAFLTTREVDATNAAQMHDLAADLLHYSPEPRVIERLIRSAELLGRTEEAAWHRQRYAAAHPAAYARWQRAATPVSAPAPAGR